jgi:hypothetical protein
MAKGNYLVQMDDAEFPLYSVYYEGKLIKDVTAIVRKVI